MWRVLFVIASFAARTVGVSSAIFLECELIGSDVNTASGFSDVTVYGDLDGDGRVDLLAQTSSKAFKVYKQTSSRTFGNSTEVLNSTTGTTKKMCQNAGPVDLDKDGVHDFIFIGAGTVWGSNRGSPDLVLYGTADTNALGTVVAHELAGNQNKFSNRCDVGDFDGDGNVDVAVVNVYFGENDAVFMNSGGRSFASARMLSTNGFGHDIRAADIDRDGKLDLVVAQSDGHGEYVLYGEGDGTFTDAYEFNSGSSGVIALCDLNGDGHPDAIVGDFYASQGIRVYLNAGTSASRASRFPTAITISTSYEHVYGIACGDVDGDGDNDVIIGQSASSAIYFENIGGSAVLSTTGVEISDMTNAGILTLYDVDGDGYLDLLGSGKVCFNAANNRTCDASSNVANGVASPCTASLADGISCQPVCNHGYLLSGSRSCASGTLTDTATCDSTACTYTTPTNGGDGSQNDPTSCKRLVTGGNPRTLPSGETCTPVCDSGYALLEDFSCTNGVMTGGTCDAVAPSPSSPIAVALPPPAPAPCEYKTPTNGDDGSPDDPTSCESLVTSGNPKTLPSGETCTPVCDSGYALLEDFSCTNGVMTGGTCDAVAPSPSSPIAVALPPPAPAPCEYKTPTNGDDGSPDDPTSCKRLVKGGKLPSGETCTPVCDSGYALSANFSCTNGVMTKGTCVATAPSPPCDASSPPANGDVGAGKTKCTKTLEAGTSCSPRCDKGYTVSGTTTCSSVGVLIPATCVVNAAVPNCDASAAPVKSGAENSDGGDAAAGNDATCACAQNQRVESNACVACAEGETNTAGNPVPGPDTVCTKLSSSPSPVASSLPSSVEALIAAAEAKTASAKASRDSLLEDVVDEKAKMKATLLADAAIAGVKVMRVAMALITQSDDAACDQAFSKMRLDASDGACDVSNPSSADEKRRRRLFADAARDVTVLVNPVSVNASKLTEALENLAAEGIAATTTETDPMEALRAIPGMDATLVESFATDAAAAAEATAAANQAVMRTPPPSPPPPSPPPPSSPSPLPRLPVLVAEDYSPARRLGGASRGTTVSVIGAVLTAAVFIESSRGS